MNGIQKIGIALFCVALIIFTALLGYNDFVLTESSLSTSSEIHKKAILEEAASLGVLDKTYNNNISFISDFKSSILSAQAKLKNQYEENPPKDKEASEWEYKIGDWEIKNILTPTIKASGTGWVSKNTFNAFLLTFGLAILGGFIFIIPKFFESPGIKNDGIYHSSLTKGLKFGQKLFFITSTILGVLIYGFFYMGGNFFWPLLTAIVIGIILFLVFNYQKEKTLKPTRSASSEFAGWLGIFAGVYLIIFYVILYWSPQYLTNWITMVDPISQSLSGNDASQWFLYGLLYTVIVFTMGIRMIAKYRHNKYQIIRTCSVMFFQTAIAFILPEILVRLNYPYYDFKNIWPLNYTFFFDWNINNLLESGGLGIFMLVWGIVLIILGVPIITYFFGKRWYCSWVCGCGGLAETMGDPFRQLSDKSIRAWKFERWIIHGVLVFAVVMTAMVLYHFFTGSSKVLFFDSNNVRQWYGFLIGSAFAGVVGTGFYPLMGNRTWCRFGCPLAAYLGLVQKYKSRFRITTNGGQCISCGNCSTYCEMGIDVRAYAQKGQDIVRSSCVGCGICSAVCPRGVLRLENASGDIAERTDQLRTIHITEDQIGIL